MNYLPLLGIALVICSGCVDSSADAGDEPAMELGPEPVAVSVDLERELAVVPPHAFGIHTSVYDNALHSPDVPELLRAAGVSLEDVERALVLQALQRTGWNHTRAATLLGLNRDQIRYRVEKFGLEKSGA